MTGNAPMAADADTHLVIGAGFSGLGVAAALKRRGIPVTVVDAADDIGGNWYHGVYEHVHIISSRRTTAYTDWPMPADWPDFPSAGHMLTYLRGYADHWDLRPLIACDTRVTRVEPAPDDHWLVTFADGRRRTFAGVVVCNGHHWDRRMPQYPGRFTGQLIHAKDYKSADQLRGRRVLVIGGGNSACDIAVDAARCGQSAHLSLRRGYWFLPKTALGVPTVELLKPWMPLPVQQLLVKCLVRLIVGPYERYGLPHPDHAPFTRHPTINGELLHFLRHGRITPHPDVRRLDGDTVTFADGSQVAVDLIVAATGYHVSFPFLADGLVRWQANGMPEIITGILPPDHKNLYFFGLSQPRYGAGPLISAGAATLCTMIETQRALRHPLGAVLRRLGVKPLTTWIQDPFHLLRLTRRSQRLLRHLPRLEPWIMAGR